MGEAALLGLPAQVAAFQADMAGQLAPLAGVPGQLAQMAGQLAQMAGQLAQLAGLPDQVAALQLQVTAIQAAQQQQQRNSWLRLANSQAATGAVSLHVISKEQAGGQQPLGAQPTVRPDGLYPATRSDLSTLTHRQMDELAAFYHEPFGTGPAAAPLAATPILQRHRMFARFIGCPEP